MSGTSHRISCADVEALLPAIADEQLDADQAPDVYAHLATCTDCQESLALYDLCSLGLAGGRIPAHDPAPVVHYHLPRWVTGLTALAAGLVLALSLWRFTESKTSSPSLAEQSDVEILQVIPDTHGRGQLYLIRAGDQTLLVNPKDLDDSVAGSDGRPVHVPVQVLNGK
jgi:hypothetical protein